MKPLIAAAAALAIVGQPLGDARLRDLFDQHRWFDLRDASVGRPVPPLYAGATASAFNRIDDAEKYLNRAIREAQTTRDANEARDMLANLYLRLSRLADMLRVLDDMLAVAPNRSDIRTAREAFAPFRQLPAQSAHAGRGIPFACEVSARGVTLPVVVNGTRVEWLFDSGFSNAALSQAEARMLGIEVRGAMTSATDLNGGSAPMRTAVADRISIGDAELRHVPLLVFSDDRPPWNDIPAGRRGAVGLPIVYALGGISWKRDGTCRVGAHAASRPSAPAPIAFDGETPLVRATVSNSRAEFMLDTGNQGGTQLWSRFARDYPDLVAAGAPEKIRVEQIGGAVEREITAIPEIRVRFGDFVAVLRPAHVFDTPVGNGFWHGNIGVDVLSQAAEVVLNFRAMTLTLR